LTRLLDHHANGTRTYSRTNISIVSDIAAHVASREAQSPKDRKQQQQQQRQREWQKQKQRSIKRERTRVEDSCWFHLQRHSNPPEELRIMGDGEFNYAAISRWRTG
jgi:hypothetical protein